MKDLQKKVSSVPTCHRLLLLNNWEVGYKSLPVDSRGKWVVEMSHPSHIFLRQFLLHVPSICSFRKVFPRASPQPSNCRKFVWGRSQAPQKSLGGIVGIVVLSTLSTEQFVLLHL